MVGLIMSSFGVVIVAGLWGESVMWTVLMSGVLFMCSSDSFVWKSCSAGEMDYVGWSLSILSLWVIMLATMGSVSIKKDNWLSSGFVGLNMGLVSALLLSFYVSDFMFFFMLDLKDALFLFFF